MQPVKVVTSARFRDFVNLPENSGRLFELIDGEIVEYMPSNPAASEVGGDIYVAVKLWLKQHPIARATPADGGYDIDDTNTFAPDIAVILKSRQEKFPREGFNTIPPDFVVEVVSPSDLKDPENRIQKKLKTYQAARIPLVWYVFPERKEVEVYVPDKPMKIFGINDTLDGGDVLPGFTLAVKDIFGE